MPTPPAPAPTPNTMNNRWPFTRSTVIEGKHHGRAGGVVEEMAFVAPCRAAGAGDGMLVTR